MANTVYTESVVTLNSSQAEATMAALKSSADELRKKMIEATKLGNTEDAAKYQKQLDTVNKSMQGIKKETKDYSEIMKKLNGSSLNELAKAYSGLNKQIKNLVPGTKEFIEKSKQLKQVKQQMDEINGSVKGTNKTLDSLKGLLPKLGIATIFAAAAKAVVKFGKDAISQTQLVGDQWGQFTSGAKSAYDTFIKQISSGDGWKNLIANMRKSYRVGKEVAAMLDELFERENSLSLQEARSSRVIAEANNIMRDTSKSAKERMDAAELLISEEEKLYTARKDIAKEYLDARAKDLEDKIKMDDDEKEWYINRYNENRESIKQAQEYSAKVKEINAGLKALMFNAAHGMDVSSSQKQLNQQLAELEASTSSEIKYIAEMDEKYQRSDDKRVRNYIQALNRYEEAEANFTNRTQRAQRTRNQMRQELSKEGLAAYENAYKAEIAGVDQHQKEMEVKAKEAYASGEINEQQYQNRLIAIHETALKSKKAIAERYKKDTVEYQSQLLDLTIKQQEEFKKILDQAEADAAKVLADISAESGAEIAAIMEEVDADFENQMNHLLELADQADMVKAMLDPQTALGMQLQSEMDSLQEMYDNKLLSEEEFQQAKQQLVKDFVKANLAIELDGWMQGIEVAQQFCNQAANMVSALQDAEMASLDAQMQAELTAAGDNAEERERIEAEYEEKKLEIQKKYAVADMVVNIAKAVAAGALASIQAWTAAGGNPIIAGIFMALIAATTAAEIATIVAQKNAIMNTTANSSGTSSTTGARVATGYSSGGYTSEGTNDYQEVGVVHANEWVAPASMVRANPIIFRKLEQARKKKTPVSGVAGFADGGMTTPVAGTAQTMAIEPSILAQLTTVLQYIIDNGIPAYVLLSELNSKQELQNIIKKATGKK